MITKVVLAKLSPTMEEGTLVRWAKQEGDPVKVGDVLAEIETDKANMEMEALGEGVLRKVLLPAGGKAPVGQVIALIAEAGEDLSEALAAAPVAATAAPTPGASAPQTPARTPAMPEEVAPGRGGRRVKASPLARRMAAEGGVRLEEVPGSGPGGRIVKRDIEAHLVRAPGPATLPRRVGQPPAMTADGAIPLSSMRKTIARRLAESKLQAPHFYVTVEVDMDAAASLREQLLRSLETRVSYNDLVVRACALALTRFPTVNASWGGDKLLTHGGVHVGVAVALPDGLITPVVRDAQRKSVLEIAAEIKILASRAREKKLKPEEFTGSTFTVSNLGMYDVSEFTAIINPPESAILAVGSVRKQPVADGDRVRIGHRMKVTLSADHRVVDGALAAQFLGEVRRLLENPIALFV